jgi:hypothetical protein
VERPRPVDDRDRAAVGVVDGDAVPQLAGAHPEFHGVIGATRLNYARIIPLVDYTGRTIGRLVG